MKHEQKIWERSIQEDLLFWKQYVSTRGIEWPDKYKTRLDPQSLLQENLIAESLHDILYDSISIIDVGAGPFTTLGKTSHHCTKAEGIRTMLYHWKIRLLKMPGVNVLWRYWRAWRGDDVGNYNRIPEYIHQYAPGRSFVDIGCMWGVNGEYAFLAEEAGATIVKGVDVFGPTPEFRAKKEACNSGVEFILGDASHPDTLAQVGRVDIVFCAGVLYHHPSPFDLLVSLRRMCKQTLILRTSTIPEIKGLPNAAVYYPMLTPRARQLWNLKSLGVSGQVGIADGFEPQAGYGNWFWGLTPSCLASLLETAGFRVDHRAPEAFVQTFICSPIEPSFVHRLPSETEAQSIGEAVSKARIARPA